MNKLRIKIEQSPKEVNDRLLERFGISLFRFAQAFAVSPLDLVLQKPRYPVSLQEIRAARTSMKKAWDAIEEDGRRFSSLMDKFNEEPTGDFSREAFYKEKGIEDFRLKYYLPRLWLVLVLEFNRGARQGIGLSKKSIIAIGWCNQIANGGQKIDWTLLCDLYDWFWQRVAPYDYYREWDPGKGIEDYLKNQFHRYRWVGDTDKYLENVVSMTDAKLAGFVFKLFLLRWRETKIKYPIEELPITNKELPRFIRNFLINTFLGKSEGVSLFAKNGSLADPAFYYLYDWLRKIVKDDILLAGTESISRMLEPLIKLPGPAYEGTEVGAFIDYASSLYLDNKVDLKNLPPLIIFPDKKYYSPAF